MSLSIRENAVVLIVVAVVTLVAAATVQAAPSAGELLAKADRSRGAVEGGMTWKLEMTTKEDGIEHQEGYTVQVKGEDARAEAFFPARAKGEVMLFNQRALWIYRPGMRQPMSISPKQRLTGQAANGDIASTRYAKDYEGEVVGTDQINGEAAYRLELKAKTPEATYSRIRYWVSASSGLGLKAEFLSAMGKAIKTAEFSYAHSLDMGGEKIPFVSQVVIHEAQFPENWTKLRYGKPVRAAIADRAFNVASLGG